MFLFLRIVGSVVAPRPYKSYINNVQNLILITLCSLLRLVNVGGGGRRWYSWYLTNAGTKMKDERKNPLMDYKTKLNFTQKAS